jgi:hypothetical protein
VKLEEKAKEEELDLKKVSDVLLGAHELVQKGINSISQGELERAVGILHGIKGEIYAMSVVLDDEAEKSKAVHNETLMGDLAKVRVLLRPVWQEYDASGRSWGRSLTSMALEAAMEYLDRHISLNGELINRMDRHRGEVINEFWSELRQLEREDLK